MRKFNTLIPKRLFNDVILGGEIRCTTGTSYTLRKVHGLEWQCRGSLLVSVQLTSLREYTNRRLVLDPGNNLFLDWFKSHPVLEQNLVVDVRGKDGSLSKSLAEIFPILRFEVQDSSQVFLSHGQKSLPPSLKDRITFQQREDFLPQHTNTADKVFAYVIRNVLWNLSDNDCITLLQMFTSALQQSPNSVLLVNELLSPLKGSFESHVEQAYRRRDVTLMTMHNVKQRTEDEWTDLLTKAMPGFEVSDIHLQTNSRL